MSNKLSHTKFFHLMLEVFVLTAHTCISLALEINRHKFIKHL